MHWLVVWILAGAAAGLLLVNVTGWSGGGMLDRRGDDDTLADVVGVMGGAALGATAYVMWEGFKDS